MLSPDWSVMTQPWPGIGHHWPQLTLATGLESWAAQCPPSWRHLQWSNNIRNLHSERRSASCEEKLGGEASSATQYSEIIIHNGKLGSATTVWRWFRNHYPNIPKSRIPSVRTFSRLIQRFTDTISTEKWKTSGRKAETMTEENIETIRQMIKDDYLWFLCLCKQLLWLSHNLKN